MRTGPGGDGRAASERVEVSYRRTLSRYCPAKRLVARQRLQNRPELRPALDAGERDPKRPQVAADGLQLPDERLRVTPGERLREAGAELGESRQRLGAAGLHAGRAYAASSSALGTY